MERGWLMSTYFRPNTTITLDDIAKVNSILSDINDKTIEDTVDYIHVILRENNSNLFYRNKNYLHFDMNKKGHIIDVRRYGSNNDSEILEPIEEHLGMLFISEHDEDYSELADDETNVVSISLERGC